MLEQISNTDLKNKITISKKFCTLLFTAALFTTPNIWKQPKVSVYR